MSAPRASPPLLDATAGALAEVLAFQQPADGVLSAFFRRHRQLGAHDRAFAAETVFGALRHLLTLRRLAPGAGARGLMLAYLVKWAGLSLRDLDAALSAGERAELARLKAARGTKLALAEEAELPDWIIERLSGGMEREQILQLGRALQDPAPLDLRVNTLRGEREEALAALARDGLAGTPTPYSPVGIRLAGKPAINRHPLFLAGAIEVQDEGSQLLGYLVAPRRNDMVVDFCAGAGGKTLLLGALMHSRGRLYAFDPSDKRLAALKPRLARSGLSNVHPQRIESENDARVKRLAGKIDRVLVDAPCSGLGTLRRNPDLKFRQSPQSVAELARKQAAILEAAARLVKPGGRLVYATCSFLPAENEDVVSAFLARHPEFAALDCAQLFARQRIALDTGPFLRLSPPLHHTDGFFAAALERAR